MTRHYRAGIKARQQHCGRWECKHRKDSVPYQEWMRGWSEENERLSADSECMARFTDTGAAIGEAQWLADQNGYPYAICSVSTGELFVKALFKASIDKDEVLEVIHPLAKFSCN